MTQKIIFIAILALILPQAVFGQTRQELEEKEKQADLRVRQLQESVQVEESELAAVTNSVKGLQNNISQIQSELYENETRINQLNEIIGEREAARQDVEKGLAVSMGELAAMERTSTLALLFRYDNFSDALREIDNKQVLTEKIVTQYQEITEHTESLETARDQLELAKLSLASARVSLDLQHQALRAEQDRQLFLVQASKSQLKAAESERAEIRRQLFAGAFDNSGKAITFDEAIHYAKLAAERLESSTGQKISVPLILALVRQESNFGNYLGKGHYLSAMCNQSQIDAFIQITSGLGLNPDTTPVSKPARLQSCGGAMGYAQFLPRTWLGYAEKVASLTGHNPPSPWNPEDAFMAVSLKLAANGASGGNTQAEKRRAQWEAAMTYFSGSNWRKLGCSYSRRCSISFYGNNILAMADSYASLID